MKKYYIMHKGKRIASAASEGSAFAMIKELQRINPDLKEQFEGSTPLTVNIVPDDIASSYFKRAQGLDKFGKLDMRSFLAQVYGICGDHIREDKQTQRAIEELLQTYYK